jgi:hypothetical protein
MSGCRPAPAKTASVSFSPCAIQPAALGKTWSCTRWPGSSPSGQLYNLRVDPRETRSLYGGQPQIVKRLTKLLDKYREEGRSRP